MSFFVVAPSLRSPSHLSSAAVVRSLRQRPGKASASLRVFLNCHMQRVVWGENLPRRDEAFQFRCCKGVNRDCVFRQSAENGAGYSFGFRFVRKVLLDPFTSGIIGELVHRLTAIDRLIKFDCLLTI